MVALIGAVAVWQLVGIAAALRMPR